MRVLVICDKVGSAIHRIAVTREKYTPWHSFRVIAVHPKRPSLEQLKEFEESKEWCDIIDFQYWKTAELLQGMYDINRPCLLAHHNPYDLTRSTWEKYKINIVSNSEQKELIRIPSTVIPLPIDLNFWTYAPNVDKEFDIIMVSNRIEAKKGVLPVAQFCEKNNLRMALVGAVSDPAYFEQVVSHDCVTFFAGITDEELRDLYHKSKFHVCNSIDSFESGTLPMLEAMACGSLVITRRVGHVPDLFNLKNMVVRRGPPDDLEDLQTCFNEILKDEALQQRMRLEAVHSLRYRNYDLFAWKYSKLYHQLLQQKELVSAIVPCLADPVKIAKTLVSLLAQSYGPMEIILVCDSSPIEPLQKLVEAIGSERNNTIKLFNTVQYVPEKTVKFNPLTNLPALYKDYGLARARNVGIMEAEGQWILFCDDRMVPNLNAVENFYNVRKEGTWLYGVKDDNPKSFVENFSFVKRSDIVKIGMFNERINQYGGMTQDVRTRFELNKNKVQMLSEATAKTSRKSASRLSRIMDIAISKTQCYKLYGDKK